MWGSWEGQAADLPGCPLEERGSCRWRCGIGSDSGTARSRGCLLWNGRWRSHCWGRQSCPSLAGGLPASGDAGANLFCRGRERASSWSSSRSGQVIDQYRWRCRRIRASGTGEISLRFALENGKYNQEFASIITAIYTWCITSRYCIQSWYNYRRKIELSDDKISKILL